MRRFYPLLLVIALCGLSRPSLSTTDDPPLRAGRISALDGRALVRPPGEAEWITAEPNFPVGAGMTIATDPGSRLEIQLGGTVIALDGRTTLTMAQLDDKATALHLGTGSVHLDIAMVFEDEHVTVTGAETEIAIEEPGAYRIDSDPVTLTVHRGRAVMAHARDQRDLRSGEAAVAEAGAVRWTQRHVTVLDDWAAMRIARVRGTVSRNYVGSGLPGAEDLDSAGTWEVSASYGPVWYPRGVAADWEPYRDGRWVWVSPWGWTWIDAQPWGFTPFHYGRWVVVEGRWGWCPGERVRRPAYAPAVVAFLDVREAPSRHLPPRTWLALGPDEIYRPWHVRDLGALRAVNRGHVRRDRLDRLSWNDRQDTYVNRRFVRRAGWDRGWDDDRARRPDDHRQRQERRDWQDRRPTAPIVITDPVQIQPRGMRTERNGRGMQALPDASPTLPQTPGIVPNAPPPVEARRSWRDERGSDGDRRGGDRQWRSDDRRDGDRREGNRRDGNWREGDRRDRSWRGENGNRNGGVNPPGSGFSGVPRNSHGLPQQSHDAILNPQGSPHTIAPEAQLRSNPRSFGAQIPPEFRARGPQGGVGQGNVGQGNVGQGNVGQGNLGQGTPGSGDVGQGGPSGTRGGWRDGGRGDGGRGDSGRGDGQGWRGRD
jgi:hypothetical protein